MQCGEACYPARLNRMVFISAATWRTCVSGRDNCRRMRLQYLQSIQGAVLVLSHVCDAGIVTINVVHPEFSLPLTDYPISFDNGHSRNAQRDKGANGRWSFSDNVGSGGYHTRSWAARSHNAHA